MLKVHTNFDNGSGRVISINTEEHEVALLPNDPKVTALLKKAVIYIVPIMDVDNVFNGGSGKNQQPVDFCLDWCKKPHWNAVDSALTIINKKAKTMVFMAYLDVHSPCFYESQHYHVIEEEDKSTLENFYNTFIDNVKSAGGENSWDTMYKLHKLKKEDTIASRYVFKEWISKVSGVTSLCIEVPHWKDNIGNYITKRGLHYYGKTIGMTLAELT